METLKYMGLMQLDTKWQARELQYSIGFHVLHTEFKCQWSKVLETQFGMQLNWDVVLLPVTFTGTVAKLR